MVERNYLFLDRKLSILQDEIKTIKKPLFKRLYELCRLYKEQELFEEHPDKSTTFIGMASFNLSLSYLLTKQEHYLEEAKRWIFTAVNYPHWGNKFLVDVDLSAAWMLFGLSVSYDWLKDDLTVEEAQLLKEKIILQAKRMYKFKVETEGEGWSTAYWQNHNWINLTGLATAGYALKDECEEAKEWIESAKDNFKKVYRLLAEDGSDYEGVVYWRYGVVWLFIYAHLLKVEEGIDYFQTSGFLKNTFYYRLYQAAPNLEEIINFGDCHDTRSGHSTAMYYKMASEYQNGHAQYLGNKVRNEFLYREFYESKVKPGILPEAGLELLWYNPEIEEKTFDDLPLVKHFEDLGLIVVRSSWEKDAVHFSFKCGAPGGKRQWEESWKLFKEQNLKTRGLSHQHPDNNSFIINAFDTFLAIDEGYNRTVKAREHNVITVDGKGYRDENRNNVWHNVEESVTAEITEFISDKGLTYFAGESFKMYEEDLELTKCRRHVIYSGKDHFYILDELDSSKEHTYTFNLHTETKPKILDTGIYEYENGPGKMRVYSSIQNDNKLVQKITNTYVKAIMTSQEPDIYREIDMETLILENEKKQKSMSFLNLLSTRDAFTEEKLQVIPMSHGDQQGYSVETEDKKEIMIYSPSGVITHEDIQAKAKILVLSYEANHKLKILAVDCRYLTLQDKELYNSEVEKTVIIEEGNHATL